MDINQILTAAEQSWLTYLADYLTALDLKFSYQVGDSRFSDQTQFSTDEDFFIISPQNSWQVVDDEQGSIALTFPIAVVASQAPEEVLKAHRKIRELQMVLEQALFSSEQLLTGGFMDQQLYTIPLKTFNALGVPTGTLTNHRFEYQRGAWNDRTPEGSTTRLWVTEITARVL